jgi:hypothetical protein
MWPAREQIDHSGIVVGYELDIRFAIRFEEVHGKRETIGAEAVVYIADIYSDGGNVRMNCQRSDSDTYLNIEPLLKASGVLDEKY